GSSASSRRSASPRRCARPVSPRVRRCASVSASWSGASNMAAAETGSAWPAGTRVGVLGGSFDPIHIGHLVLAEEARDQLGLARVYLVPAGEPPHKRDRRLTPVEDRVHMTRVA